MEKHTIAVRVWTGIGVNIYAGAGYVQVKGYSESMDYDTVEQYAMVIRKACQFSAQSKPNIAEERKRS